MQNGLDLIFSGILGDLGFPVLCDGLVILAPFHRPHGHRSALLSCSHARSALHTSIRTAFAMKGGTIFWHDVALVYQVRSNRANMTRPSQRPRKPRSSGIPLKIALQQPCLILDKARSRVKGEHSEKVEEDVLR